MQIFVKLLSGLTITFDVQAADSVASLKQKIKDKQNIEPSEQRLVYSGNNLEDGRTLSDYDIPQEATLYLITSAASAKSSILAPAPTPAPAPVPVPAPAAVPRVIPPPVSRDPTTEAYRPSPPLAQPVPQQIQVTVQTTTSDRHIFNVSTSMKVRELMNMVIDKTGGSEIELCLGSKVLNTARTLAQEGVQDQALLRVVTHTRGGL